MKHRQKDQNENWFEAQNVADLTKQQSCGAKKKNKKLFSFVNCSTGVSQPSDKALMQQMQPLAELMELLYPEQECLQCHCWISLHIGYHIQRWILHLRDMLTNTSKEWDQKMEGSGNHIVKNNGKDLEGGQKATKQEKCFMTTRTQTNPEGLSQVEQVPVEGTY